jgi:hypothetical protein
MNKTLIELPKTKRNRKRGFKRCLLQPRLDHFNVFGWDVDDSDCWLGVIFQNKGDIEVSQCVLKTKSQENSKDLQKPFQNELFQSDQNPK